MVTAHWILPGVASFTDAWIETTSGASWSLNRRSHLLQMRGLKHRDAAVFKLQQESHLLQMRGLKRVAANRYHFKNNVASFTDAWIETYQYCSDNCYLLVASFTDAWIETSSSYA